MKKRRGMWVVVNGPKDGGWLSHPRYIWDSPDTATVYAKRIGGRAVELREFVKPKRKAAKRGRSKK